MGFSDLIHIHGGDITHNSQFTALQVEKFLHYVKLKPPFSVFRASWTYLPTGSGGHGTGEILRDATDWPFCGPCYPITSATICAPQRLMNRYESVCLCIWCQCIAFFVLFLSSLWTHSTLFKMSFFKGYKFKELLYCWGGYTSAGVVCVFKYFGLFLFFFVSF